MDALDIAERLDTLYELESVCASLLFDLFYPQTVDDEYSMVDDNLHRLALLRRRLSRR